MATTVVTEALYGKERGRSLLAYMHFHNISALRKEEAWAKLRGLVNTPVATKCSRKEQSTRPERECEDPYIASILISLAQEQQARGDDKGKAGWRVHLLGIPETEAWEVYFYTATIPRALLEGLKKPMMPLTLEPGEPLGFTIRYQSISLIKPRKAACLLWEALNQNALCK